MRIQNLLIDCHVFDGSFQGTTTYLKGIYLEMIKDSNYQFYFASNNTETTKKIFGIQENVHYLEYNSHNKFYRLLIDIPKLIKQNKIDFAHFQYIVPPIKYCKYITTIHDVLFLDYPQYFPLSYRLKNKFLFKWSAKKSDIVLTVSNFSKNQIEKHFKINTIAITPNAVDPVYFEPYDKVAIKEKVKHKYNIDKYWIYISRWEPRKNHHTLLEVFVENKFYKDFSLVFIGDKSLNNEQYNLYYSKLSDEIKSKIITLNKVNFDELVLLLRGADLSVYPSFAEGFGIPPLEALAAKIPSIFSNTTAMAEYNFSQEDMFDPSNKDAISKSIKAALSKKVDETKIEILKSSYNWAISASIIKAKINAIVASQII